MAPNKVKKFDINSVMRGIVYDYNGELLIMQRPEDKYSASVTYLAAHYGVLAAELDKAIQIVTDRLKSLKKKTK